MVYLTTHSTHFIYNFSSDNAEVYNRPFYIEELQDAQQDQTKYTISYLNVYLVPLYYLF